VEAHGVGDGERLVTKTKQVPASLQQILRGHVAEVKLLAEGIQKRQEIPRLDGAVTSQEPAVSFSDNQRRGYQWRRIRE